MREVIGNTTATPNPRSDWNQTDETKADYIKNKPDIAALERQIADILYNPMSITNFTHGVGLQEMGAVVTDVVLTWTTNQTPTTLALDGEPLNVSDKSKQIGGLSITFDDNGKTWKLVATDHRGASANKTTSKIAFANNIYYGVGDVERGFDSAFVTSLSKTLQSAKAYDFTVSPNNQYMYYAVPTRLGTVSFKVGGFEGGFESPETISVTNGSNYTEDYYVYRSTNKLAGDKSVDVT